MEHTLYSSGSPVIVHLLGRRRLHSPLSHSSSPRETSTSFISRSEFVPWGNVITQAIDVVGDRR